MTDRHPPAAPEFLLTIPISDLAETPVAILDRPAASAVPPVATRELQTMAEATARNEFGIEGTSMRVHCANMSKERNTAEESPTHARAGDPETCRGQQALGLGQDRRGGGWP
jgi:hypothetical protein